MKGQAKMLFNKKDFDSKQRFSIRKLSVGVCSVLLSTLFLTFNEGQTVHASTNVNAADTTTTSVSSNTTNNSSDNNTDKKDDSKVEASSLATAEKHAPIPIAAEIKSNKSEDQTNSASAETDTQVSKSKQAQNQTTTNIVKATDTQAATSSKDSSDTTSSKDNSAQNTVEKNRSTSTSKYTHVLTSETSVSTKANQSNSNSATQEKSNIKPVTPHADSTEHIAPETYTMDSDSPAYVIAGSDLTNLASKFISNADALTQSGATFSWDGNVPTATQQDAMDGNTISGTIRVTYKDGTSTTIDINSYVEARSTLQPSTFYYVNRVNDTPDFNTADANGNNFSTMIVNQYAFDSTAFSYKILGTLDTSSLGIHWANVQVMDNNTFAGAPLAPKVIGDPYVIKVPYVVQGLKLRDDIPTDANGNPVINAQLATMPKSTSTTPTTPEVAFDPAQGNSTTNVPSGLWGQYFYQDYALAYALGIKVQVAEDDLDNNGKWKNKPTVNTKTNHFAITFNNLPNATQQEVDVNYVSAPHAEDMYIYNAANKTYMTGRPENAQAIKELLADGYMNDKVWVTLADGTKVYASKLEYIDNVNNFVVGGAKSGKYNINFNASFDQKNSAGQPLIFSNNIFSTASADLVTNKNVFPEGTTSPNTNSTNEGVITIHYPASNLDQQIKVYVTVIPKTTAVDGQNFFTNGEKYDGTTGSIANGNNQGAILTQANGQAIDYTTYSGQKTPGEQTVYDTKTTSYTPTYSLSGLETNSDGSLDSGVQTATVRVSVPKGTIGAKVDADGTYYYEVNAKVNIAQKVNFEFVDEYNDNNVVGQTYSQEFIPGVATNLNFNMAMPDGYELGNGASIPSQYTLAAFSQTTPVVKVPIHQKMHFYITVHDEDSNTNLGTVEVSGSTAGNGGGWYPNINTKLTFPAGADAGDYYSVSTSGVPDGVQLVGSYGVSLTNPTADWTNPNYKWDNNTFSVLKALTGATMTINLKHKIQETQEQQTRKPTVNYIKAKVNADGTYTPDGSAFTSAVLDVYYSRTKSKDLVTKKVTYTPWLWDTKQGQNGYHVESGTWTSLPQSWGAVVADVPTLDGYTAATVTDQSGQPANQFVYPTWNKAGTSDEGKESLAYTENAPIYEARPVHTVLYVPNEQQARTITSKYVIAGGNKNGQQFAPDSQIQIFYDRTGTLNVANNTITYGNWQWDNTAGDRATPGFHVISGSWSLPTDKTSSWQVNIPNSGNDYVVANLRYDGAYSTFTLAAPSYNANDVFTSPTSDQWFTRNILVTYYVPTSMVNKTVTRTIKISEPGQDSKTITQTVKLTRQVRVNQDDTGVVYDGFAGSGWSTGNWAAQDVPTHGGYTMYATQTVNGVTTPIQLVNGQIPAEPVNGTSQDTTINITWGAVAKATLTGTGTSTYNGQAITNAELNNALKVNVTGPTAGAGTYTLQAGDVEFSIDGTNWTTALPINAGNYQVRLTAQGKNGIIGKYGNNSIIWTQNGQSTITSNATYMINKLADNAVMANAQSGNYEMTYNGAAPSTIDPSKFVFTTTVNGQTVTLDATGLNSSDFTWADGNAPVNVGTYKVVLTDAGLAKLNANNPNFDLTNSGNGTFTINQANASATLSGSASREYNGQAVSVDDLNSTSTGNNITLTLHYPKDGNANYSTTVKLNNGYFTWNTPNGQAPVNADSQPYTIVLNSDAIEGIIKQAVGNGQNDVSNVKFASDAISGSANYTITPLVTSAKLSNITEGNYTKVYDAQATNQIDASKLHITVNLGGQKVDLDTTGLTGSDYQWVDASGTALTSNPKNVGTYYIKLSDTAFAKLQAQNPNFKLTNTGLGVYTITQANASGELTGSNSKVYNGSAISLNELNSNGSIKVTLNFPGVNGQTYTLKSGDYTISGNATDAGEYTVTLTDAGKTNVENYIKSLAGTGQGDESNVKFADNAISGSASFEITPSANTVSVSGTQTETYNGSPINVVYNADDTNSVKVSITQTSGNTTGAVASLADVTLDSGDFAIVNGPAENVGSYQVKLTAAGLAKIQNAVGDNYSLSLADTTGTLVINKAKASAVFSGDPSYTYTGTPVSTDDYLGQYSIKLNEPNNPTYKLVAGDIEFNVDGNWTSQAPVKVGTYQVRLSQSGWNHIKAINSDNVEWAATASAGKGSYTIDQAKVTADLSGNSSMIYNGSAVSTADLYANGSTIKVAINGTGIANLPKSFTLEDGDYTWSTSDNQSPVNVGNYTIKLTQAGINKIQSQIDQVVGAGNVVLTTTTDDGGSASFEIKQAVAANVQLYGGENTIYNGNPVSFDPTKTETANNFGFHNVENLTVPTFTASDFTWYDGQGNKLSSAPTNAGTYYLKLNTQGEKAFADANPNYTFEENGKSTISGEIPYVVTPAELTIGVSGSASKVFNDKNAEITQEQINNGDIKLVWGNSTTEPTDLGKFTLTPSDLEVVDANGKHAIHANAGIGADGQPVKGNPYKVQLTADAIKRIKQLSGAANYKISQSAKSGEYFIYEHKAELTLTGNQTTVYGTAMPFSPSKYQLAFTNWLSTDLPVPNLTWKDNKLLNNDNDTGLTWTVGDLYVEGYPDGGVPTNVGTYRVKISKQLTDKLRQLFPDYDFSGNIGENGVDEQDNEEIVEPSHTPASYVITPANTTVKITGAQHVKYGESTNINVGDYSISITAPVHNETVDNNAERIYTNVTLAAGDLEFVTVPTNVGTYQVKLSAQGLQKLKDLTGSSNYDWTQAADAKANFFVEQMPVTIAVSGQSSVTYGTQDWLNAIKVNPSGYVLTITTENGAALSYHTVDGDLVFNQTPGNVGEYQVELSAQGLANIEEKLGTNYSYPQTAADVTAKGTFTVKQGEVTVTLNGSDGKTYNAVPTLSSGLNLDKYNVAYTTTVYSADGKAQTLNLTANDLQIIGNATNVGTYQVELSQAGQEKLEQLTGNNGANYKWTFKTNADYVVKAATASAELSGSNQKTFDGSAVTTAEVNSNGQILVHLTYPGSTTQSTYALQNGDYTWSTANGNAPTNVGTYTISLNKQAILDHLQNALNTQAGLGDNDQSNVTISADDLSGQARFTINPQTLTDVTISAPDQSKTYDAQAADLDVNGITITANGIVANNPLVNPGISASDFTWYDETGNKLESAPVDVGTYQARLNASTLAELQNTNPNYQFSSVAGLINYTINPAPATAKISGSADRDYNAQTTSVSDVMNNIKWKATGLVTDQELNLNGLTANSYAWYSKDADGNYVAMTGNPVNAGTYYLRLTKDAIAQVKADNSNYNFTSVDGEFTYTINVVNGTATLSGSSSKTYDGQAATTAEVNSTNGDIIVNFAFPGSSAQSTYALQAGDYTWENKDGQEISAPTNAGTYTIKLRADSITNLQNAINQYAGQGNVTLDAQDLLGAAVYTIKQKTLNVILGNNSTGTDGKTYDGQPAVINTQAENFGVFTTSGLVNGEDLNAANLTNDDYEWVDANGKAISAPTNAGTYYISLTANGLKKLQADNPNYAISESGQFTYVISPAEENVTISGSQESTSTSIDNANFTVHAPAGITVPTGMTYEFATGVPSESGVYVIKLTPESIAALEKTNPNYKLNISSDARFTLDATLSIEFEDTQDGNKQVGKTITKTGVANSTINDLKLVVPDNYELAPDQELPTSYTFGKTLNQNLYIKLVHKLNELNPTDPSTNPDPTNKNWFRENGLVKDVTRTINYEGLSTAQLAQIPETQKAQTVEFTRTAKYDLVTGKIVVNSEGSWTAVDGKDIFAGFTPFAFAGYTAAPAKVEQVKVTGNDKNSQITVTYTANNQTGKISYVDSQGNEVGQTALTGKTDQSVAVTPEAPTGWIIVAGQDIPKSVTATATGIPTVTVKVEHSTTIVTPETPEKDIPTGPVPGDPSKNYEKMESLTASPTRTIVVTDPSGKTTKVTQTVNFTRMATFDEVTGEITYSNWASSEPTEWSQYAAPEVAGYTATQMVKSQVVSAETADETIRISYTANTQAGKISYVDSDGKEVGQTALTGKTDQSVVVTPEAPAGWRIVPGQDIPKSVTATATGIPTVTVKVEHSTIIVTPETPEKDIPTGPVPGDPSKNYEKMESLTASPTRTIVVTDPSGKTTEVTQTVNFTRTATFDEVTGKVTYSDWKLQNSNASNHAAQWDSYTLHVITHYVPSVAEVPAKVVNAHTANSQVEITYAPASESQVIRYVDQNGKEISTQIVSGKYGLDTTFTPKLPNNWQAANTIPTSIKIGENGGLTTIVIEAKTEKVQQSKTVTETIHYHTANGKQIVADKEMKVNFTRTGVKNLVTGEITWNSWNNAEEIFNEVPSPKVSGYTASPAKVAAQTVTPNSEDLVFNVIYTKNSQTYPTIPENKPNKPQEENVSKQETKTQDKLIHEYGYKKRADGRLVDHTGHVYPASSKVKENGAIYSEKGELLSVGSRRKHELPQTGLHDNSLIAAIGSLLAGISIFGLLGGRKKKDDDK
ncbi:YSIRK-type signal peptide-containing protein [Lactobacillus paragasseri]|uniref:YSIRK-type signal peptide-containing protein n=3 Tax=Lactobacillus paragasseri TaxID=2107999 RepID=A0A6B2FVT9_9LACO|nr:YSIRK-type signal peptide-containing protein [Lactobacillus paragasseri]